MTNKIKYLMLAVMLANITGCATVMNTSKPPIRDDAAMKSAIKYQVVEKRGRYIVGDLLMMSLFPIGTIAGGVGYWYDYGHNNYYAITNKEEYKLWEKKYLEETKKARDNYLHS